MKSKLIYYIIMSFFAILNIGIFSDTFWQMGLWTTDLIYNTDSDNAVDVYDNNNPISDPLRQWIQKVIDADPENTDPGLEIWWVLNPWLIQNHSTAMNSTMTIVKNLINYALWLLSLIALVYLLYHWFIIVTAAWDDTQYKKWIKWLRLATIALTWIWLSWLLVSFIFWLINYIS